MEELIHILSDWNVWWETGRPPPELTGKPRGYTAKLIELAAVPEIKILTGVRRSGKSTLFYQAVNWLLSHDVDPRQILLINFEDEALGHYGLEDLFNVYQTHVAGDGPIFLFLDEVHEKQGWEKWVRKKFDLKQGVNFFITGSSARLLDREYATLLTGRNLTLNIFPLNFREILSFSDIDPDNTLTASQKTRNRITSLLHAFLQKGGFPEVFFRTENMQRMLLNQYFQDIIYKDIVNRHQVHPVRIRDLASYLITNISNLISLRALRGTFGYGLNTIADYIGFLEEAFLIYQMYHFDYSFKQQIMHPRKIYAVDNGLRNAVAFKFSRDMGRLMENAVYTELRRRGKEIYYWKDKNGREVDFLIKSGPVIENAVQVCADADDARTAKREIAAAESAMAAFGLETAEIITLADKAAIETRNPAIKVRSLAEWLARQ